MIMTDESGSSIRAERAAKVAGVHPDAVNGVEHVAIFADLRAHAFRYAGATFSVATHRNAQMNAASRAKMPIHLDLSCRICVRRAIEQKSDEWKQWNQDSERS